VRYRFSDKHLEALYTADKGAEKYEPGVVKAFFRVMALIGSMPDIRDLYQFKSLRFEKLSGDRQGQHSLRLNNQWRLIILIETDDLGNQVVVIEIVDYH
jgi:proteic killer suppression protein